LAFVTNSRIEQRVLTGESAAQAMTNVALVELEPLFTAHYPSVWRLLRRLGVPEPMLDDAAQEVFWVAARRLSDIRPESAGSFLYGVALRVASSLLRRERSEAPLVELGAARAIPNPEPSPEQCLEERRARELLDVAIAKLPLELRTVFVLYELEGLQIREIAEIEALPIGTASSRLRRAREEFASIAKRLRATLGAKERR